LIGDDYKGKLPHIEVRKIIEFFIPILTYLQRKKVLDPVERDGFTKKMAR
jgi:hypothetical protein